MLSRLSLSATNRPLDVIRHWADTGDLLLSPPYQRGDVWGPTRRQNLIRSILLGVPIPCIIVNDRLGAGWAGEKGSAFAVIDGKQRITTILDFLENRLLVPGSWFGTADEELCFSMLPMAKQRGLRCLPIPFAEGRLPTIEMEEEVFNLVNFGGVPQGQSDFPG